MRSIIALIWLIAASCQPKTSTEGEDQQGLCQSGDPYCNTDQYNRDRTGYDYNNGGYGNSGYGNSGYGSGGYGSAVCSNYSTKNDCCNQSSNCGWRVMQNTQYVNECTTGAFTGTQSTYGASMGQCTMLNDFMNQTYNQGGNCSAYSTQPTVCPTIAGCTFVPNGATTGTIGGLNQNGQCIYNPNAMGGVSGVQVCYTLTAQTCSTYQGMCTLVNGSCTPNNGYVQNNGGMFGGTGTGTGKGIGGTILQLGVCLVSKQLCQAMTANAMAQANYNQMIMQNQYLNANNPYGAAGAAGGMNGMIGNGLYGQGAYGSTMYGNTPYNQNMLNSQRNNQNYPDTRNY